MKWLILLAIAACSTPTSSVANALPMGEALRRDEYLLKACYGMQTLKRKTCEENLRTELGWAPK